MKLIELQCVNCGGTLIKKGSQSLECPYCGAAYLIDKDSNNGNGKMGTDRAKLQVFGAVSIVLVAVLLVGALSLAFRTPNLEDKQGEETIASTVIPTVAPLSDVDKDTSNTYTWQEAIDAGIVVISGPEEGEGFQVFAERLLGKPYMEITQKEWEKVSSIRISGVREYHDEISCVVEGVTKEFFYEGSAAYIIANIHHFVNLETLEVDNSIANANLTELKKLKKLRCNNTIGEILVVLPHPENIISLAGVEAENSLEGIEQFTNLRTLELDAREQKDLTALTSLKNLEALVLEAREVKNFLFLNELTNLKRLYIDSENLYSLDFVQNMKELEALEVERTAISSLAPLDGNTQLKTLMIEDCEEILDYEVLNTLINLENLSISGSEMEGQIQWGNLKKLKYLKASNIWDNSFFESVAQLSNLESLYLSWVGSNIFNFSSFETLKHLTITNSYNTICFAEGKTNLESVTLVEVDEVQGVEHIFSQPKLKAITVFDCNLVVDFDKIQENESLEKFELQYCKLREIITNEEKRIYYYDDCVDVELKDKVDFLKRLSSVRELTIRGAKLENIDFVTSMPHLEKLDITNNNIADVSVLNQCEHLVQLECGDNALLEKPVFDRDVVVGMTGETNSWYQ